jgi:hypothetical protein
LFAHTFGKEQKSFITLSTSLNDRVVDSLTVEPLLQLNVALLELSKGLFVWLGQYFLFSNEPAKSNRMISVAIIKSLLLVTQLSEFLGPHHLNFVVDDNDALMDLSWQLLKEFQNNFAKFVTCKR